MSTLTQRQVVERLDSILKLIDDAQLATQGLLADLHHLSPASHSDGRWRDASVSLLQCALQQAGGAAQYCNSTMRLLTDVSSAVAAPSAQGGSTARNREPKRCVTSIAEGRIVSTVVAHSQTPTERVEVSPDYQFQSLHRDVRLALGNSLVQARSGGQALLIPLFVVDQCSVAVERPVPATQPALSIGFTVAAVVGLASKLLWAMDKKLALKGVIVTRRAKADQVGTLLDALPRTIQQVNLLNPSSPPPAQVHENHPRIIACTAQDIIERDMIRTDDIDHLIIDDCDEATAKIFANGSFKKLRDVVLRGPLNVLHKLPTPSSTRYRARLWTVERTVNIFDVQAFTMARQIEELFASFPPGRNYLHTTQTNVFLQNATVIPSLDLLPEDVDHLVIADIPFTVAEVSAMLRKAAARVVLIVCSQPSAKPTLVDALAHEGLVTVRALPLSGVAHGAESPHPAMRF